MDLGTAIGTGKQNTATLVNNLNGQGVYGNAAQYCTLLKYGGYNDWFLPSKDELNLMFVNLKQKGLGGFSNSWYLSSTTRNSRPYPIWSTTFYTDGSWVAGSGGWVEDYAKAQVRAVRQF